MDYGVTKVNELIGYLNNNRQAIRNEGCSSISVRISELLQLISVAQNSGEGCLRDAAVAYQVDRTFQYLNAMIIPPTASTANRIFNCVIKKELLSSLGSDFKIPEGMSVDENQTFQAQAMGYENLASLSSYEEKFMRNSLLSAMHCYLQANQGQESRDSMRIKSFLDTLEAPVKLIYAKRYLLTSFQKENIPFSITNPRCIEVMLDFCRMVNESPNDVTIVAAITKCIKVLR